MNFFIKSLMILLTCLTINIEAKSLIITHSYLRPDFIELQDKTFKKFIKDDYEFVVFNDAKNLKIRKEINEICKKLNLRCIPIPKEIHTRPYLHRQVRGQANANIRCANVVQYSLNELGFDHDGVVMIIDSDMFVINEFSIEEYMIDHDLSAVAQSRGNGAVRYIWNGLVFLNMNTLPDKRELNFNCGRVEGHPVDVGGYTHYYFKNHPDVRFSPVKSLHVSRKKVENQHPLHPLIQTVLEWDKKVNRPINVEFLLDHTFFHYRGGGNWNNMSDNYHSIKTQMLHQLIDSVMQT
ncbi:MAG: hypothetical protein ChlgKO_05260 [Chlamydiales bacterium]